MLVLQRVRDGYRLPCPPDCPDWLYANVIAPCWFDIHGNPPRPTFEQLVSALVSLKSEIAALSEDELLKKLTHDEADDDNR
jgi:hypothetical protein